MEQRDLELEQRVWQRVSGMAPAGEKPELCEKVSLGEMERRCRESASVFRQLAQASAGQMREALQEFHRQEYGNAMTILGIRVLSGEEPEKPACCPWNKTGFCRALALAYRRSCQARGDYLSYAAGGEYAPVFAAMAQAEGEKMARILALIGISKGG